MTIHDFYETGGAYNACQTQVHPRTMAPVNTGDILTASVMVGGETYKVVGMADTWPFAVTAARGQLHEIAFSDEGQKAMKDWWFKNVNPLMIEELFTTLDRLNIGWDELSLGFQAMQPWLESTYGVCFLDPDEADDELSHGEEPRVNYPPEGDVKDALATLGDRFWNPQAIDTLISMREQLDIEIYPKMTTDGEKELLHNMIVEIDKALVGHHKSVDAAMLRLEQGKFVYEGSNGEYFYEGHWTPSGHIVLPNTPASRLAIAGIMQLSIEDLNYGLEEEGECSSSGGWMVGYVPEGSDATLPELKYTKAPEPDSEEANEAARASGQQVPRSETEI